MSIGGTYIYKHTTDMFVNIPINRETARMGVRSYTLQTARRPAGDALSGVVRRRTTTKTSSRSY